MKNAKHRTKNVKIRDDPVQTLVLLQRLANFSSYHPNHSLSRQHRPVLSEKNPTTP